MHRVPEIIFAAASFLASMLLFSVQPMIGKMALPYFGGTPAVWNTCLVYFQSTLLCGYLLAFALVQGESPRSRWRSWAPAAALGFALVLGFLAQPIAISDKAASMGAGRYSPTLALLTILATSAALPLVLVSASAPLLQRWFSLSQARGASDPYFLYAASNAGSLIALLAYPFAIEPYLALSAQARLWRTGFLVLAVLLLTCAAIAFRRPRANSDPDRQDQDPVKLASETGARLPFLRWLTLVFIPSSWLVAVTAYVTIDLAPIPLLWMIPLALYLLSFVIAFSRWCEPATRAAAAVLPYFVLALVLVMIAGFVHLVWIPLHWITFFAGAVVCHGWLARARPPAHSLTIFYLAIAFGGLLGGLWSAIVAPLIFARVVEYPLALVLACLVANGIPSACARLWPSIKSDLVFAAVVFLLAAVLATDQWGLAESAWGALGLSVAAGLGVLACVTAAARPGRFAFVTFAILAAGALAPGPSGRLLHVERDFYGVLRVTHDDEHNVNRLFHGSTLHGQQSLDPRLRREPSTYFTRSGPIGQLFEAAQGRLREPGARVAIVGLGAGTIASYAKPGQRWTFYELDPAVERIARDPRFFSYLADCPASKVEIVLGDARLKFREAADHAYSLIVLDAFSSDSLPVHLLAREAFAQYRAKLAPGGLIALNLSSRYLDLGAVVARQALDAGMTCRVRHDVAVSDDEKKDGKQPSIWGVMAESPADLGPLETDPRWRSPAPRPGSRAWTDDYSELASYLLWNPATPRGPAGS